MRKILSGVLAFLLIWAIAFGVVYLVGIFVDYGDPYDWKYYLTIGFGAAVGGRFGPTVASSLTRRFKKS